MNKKDIRSLMEAYDEVASLSISPEDHDEGDSDFSRKGGLEVRSADSYDDGNQDLEELEDKKIQMVETHLRSIVAHAHQAISAIKKGSVIEPWMQDLIAISADNIVNTANALVYRHDVD